MSAPVRILHVVGGMNRGGIETWLMHVLRRVDRARFAMDFVAHTSQRCAYDDELRGLGAAIYPCPHPGRPLRYARTFRRILRDHGPYDVVHSHVHDYSGYVLRLAKQGGVRGRIAHSHNDTSPVRARAGILRRGYYGLMSRWIDRYATAGLAASRQAAADLFGPAWETDRRWQVLHYGIDLDPFRHREDAVAVRAELGLPANTLVLGHVGRFMEQKNHAFLLRIAAEVARRVPETHLLLVGEGELRAATEAEAGRLGLAGRVTFAGVRSDVPRLMLQAMDVFVLPSLYEGLPLVLVETQAAGLMSFVSDVITPEAACVMPVVRRLSLAAPAAQWAEAILAARGGSPVIPREEALRIVERSSFNIRLSIERLEGVYRGCVARAGTGKRLAACPDDRA